MADLEKSSSESENPNLNPQELGATSEDDAEEGSAGEESEPVNRRGRRAAASQARKQRLREREEAEAVGLDAQEMIDDALVRSSSSVGKWFRTNSTWLQIAAVVGVAVWAGWGIYGWRSAAAKASASDKVSAAVAAERGRIGDPPAAANPDYPDPTPQFKDEAERIKAAKEAFALAAKERPGSGTSVYSKLAMAALMLDNKMFDEAGAAFRAVKADPLAASDPELRGRSLEGVALAAEGQGDPAAALKAYAELEAAAVPGFVELALYQQARLTKAQGDEAAAKALLEKLNESQAKDERTKAGVGYLSAVSKTLSNELGVSTPADDVPAAGPGQITPAQLKALQEKMQRAISDKVPKGGSVPVPAAGGAAGK